ncbi:MAG TPA: ATP-grasp domain-containing protein [Pirellulaceae bacterium]|nr:ATP-grasp domain-containing protein [Pirellulaceae bacterium]
MPLKIFLYEFITGGGMFSVATDEIPAGSLLREGAAMFDGLVRDLVRIPHTDVVALRDARLTIPVATEVKCYPVANRADESSRFDSLAADADWTIVIAPEFDHNLLKRTRRVEELGGRLLGPNSLVVELGTCKERTIAHLAARGIRTPAGCRFHAGCQVPPTLRFPAVIKPHDGAGSQGVQRIENREALASVADGMFRLEEFQPGVPASVAVLCGPHATLALPACRQRLTADGSFRYLGGRLPLDEPLRGRAERLARSVVETLPDCRGYIGVDMVLGELAEFDTVIELNPRMTTSYVGLRQLAIGNLAEAMIELAAGRTPDLSFADRSVEFLANGTIVHG